MMLRLWLFGLAFTLSSLLPAQLAQPMAAGGSWEVVESEHILVYAKGPDAAAANKIARMAELARYELGILFDYRPTGSYRLMYFPSTQALLQSNLDWGNKKDVPGRLYFPKGFGIVVHPGTSEGLYHEVRKALAKMILEEFAAGNRFSTIVQEELLLYEAQWFMEGLVEYAGSGWNYEDERKVSTLMDEDFIGMAIEGNGVANKLLRKSIWNFIVHEYGQQKISEIVYLVNISHSIESGIISVLGITLNTLTLRWERYMKARQQNMLSNRFKIGDYGSSIEIPLPPSHTLAGVDFDPDSNRLAAVLNHEGLLTTKIYHLNDRNWESTPIKSGFQHADAELLDFESPIVWHPDGRRIYTPIWEKGQYLLAMYDISTTELTYRELPKDVGQIFDMDITHDGRRIAFSGLHRGRIDIYAGPAREGRFKAMTNDVFDNLHPSWSEDDQTLFFSSNRKEMGANSLEQQLYSYRNSFDIFQLIMTPDTSLWAQITKTPHVNEISPEVEGTTDVWYLSDRSGIFNLEKVQIFQHKISPLTNLAYGIGQQRVKKSSILVTMPVGGRDVPIILGKGQLGESQFPDLTIQRLESDSKRKIEEQKRKLALEKAQAIENQKIIEEEEQNVEEDKTEEQQAPKKTKKPVRYYIFDDEDEPYEVRKPDREALSESRKDDENRLPTTVFGRTPTPQLDKVEVSRAKRASSEWKSQFLGLNMFYDPISTLGIKFDMNFQDLAGNHELNASWTPFIRLRVAPRDHIVKADYTYKKNKIDLRGEAGLTTRFLRIQDISTSLDSLIFRYDQIYANAGARLPLSAKSFVEGKVGILRLDRLDQRLTRLVLLNDRDNLLRGGLLAKYEDTEEQDGYKLKGFKAEASADYFFSVNNGQQAFYRTHVSLNYFRPIYENIVFDVRLSGGFSSLRSVPQYYLGGVPGQLHNPIVFQRRDENRIRDNSVDTALYALHFAQFINPMRGFGYNTRAGSRYMIANIEVHIPVSRLLRYSLQPNSLYNIELIPFIDAGTVWTEGNPFSQRKPTDTQFITSGNVTIKLQTLKSPFLIGMGTGVRINLLSWSARFDLAWGLDDYTLQRPQLTTSVSRNF